MSTTIYATFNDVEQGERAAGALLDHGVQKEDLSLVANPHGTGLGQAHEVGAVSPVAEAYLENPTGVYSGTAPSYEPAAFTPPVYDTQIVNNNGDTDDPAYRSRVTQAGVDDVDPAQVESVAKSGITTTTPQDAGAGAIAGTEIGLGLGILAGIAALLVPGVGLVLGGGALAGAIGTALSTTVAGAAVGGVVGYLKDQGVDEADAVRYQETLGSGGALLAVTLPSNGIGLDEAQVVLNKYGATDISSY